MMMEVTLVSAGIRACIEAMNLKWKHINYFWEDRHRYLSFALNGKTKH